MYSAFRRYLQGMGVVQPIMIALVLANIVNVVFNWILIFGNLGAPAMGVRGSAWATVLARVMMAAMLFARHRPARTRTTARSVRDDDEDRVDVDAPSD